MAEQRRRLKLDPSDPEDRRIIKRQQQAARQAGREGRDRTSSTRGRPDLEAAYDQGAAAARDEQDPDAESDDQADEDEAAPGRAAQLKAGVRSAASKTRAGVNKAGAPLSKGSWRPSLKALTGGPIRAQDAGSLLTGALVYTAIITYIRYGPDGLKGWLAAKFVNRPMAGPPASSLGKGANPAPNGVSGGAT